MPIYALVKQNYCMQGWRVISLSLTIVMEGSWGFMHKEAGHLTLHVPGNPRIHPLASHGFAHPPRTNLGPSNTSAIQRNGEAQPKPTNLPSITTHHTPGRYSEKTAGMTLIRATTALRAARAVAIRSPRVARPFSTTLRQRGGGQHESPYEPPTGWLWGVKPGEKVEKEGWENGMFYVFIPSCILLAVALAFKPDNS